MTSTPPTAADDNITEYWSFESHFKTSVFATTDKMARTKRTARLPRVSYRGSRSAGSQIPAAAAATHTTQEEIHTTQEEIPVPRHSRDSSLPTDSSRSTAKEIQDLPRQETAEQASTEKEKTADTTEPTTTTKPTPPTGEASYPSQPKPNQPTKDTEPVIGNQPTKPTKETEPVIGTAVRRSAGRKRFARRDKTRVAAPSSFSKSDTIGTNPEMPSKKHVSLARAKASVDADDTTGETKLDEKTQKKISRSFKTFQESIVHSAKYKKNPGYWETEMKKVFVGRNPANSAAGAHKKRQFVLQFAGPAFQEKYGMDYWLYACMNKGGIQKYHPHWEVEKDPSKKLLTLDMIKAKCEKTDPWIMFPKFETVQLWEPEPSQMDSETQDTTPTLQKAERAAGGCVAGQNPEEEEDGDKKPAAKGTDDDGDKKPAAKNQYSRITDYCYGNDSLSARDRRQLRMRFKNDGDTSYEVLRECIIPADEHIPTPLGFQITHIPTELYVGLVRGYGSKVYTETYEKCGDLINLCLDEQPIMQLVMGDMDQEGKLVATTDIAVAMDRFAQVTGLARSMLETAIVDHVSQAEAKMADETFGRGDYPDVEGEFNTLSEDQVKYWTKVSKSLREEEGWPESFTELDGSTDRTLQGKQEAMIQQLNLNLQRAKDAPKDDMEHPELHDLYMETLGFVPIWERTQHGTYLMHSWGMDHLTKKKFPLMKRDMTAKQLADAGLSVSDSSYMKVDLRGDMNLGELHDWFNDIIYRCIIIVLGGNPDDPRWGWEYVVSSGVVRTGMPTRSFYCVDPEGEEMIEVVNTGQEIHLDNKRMLAAELFQLAAERGSPEKPMNVSTREMAKWGWIGDLCLSETGRPYKTTVFDPDKKLIKIKIGWTPSGTINVRHMVWPHSGHGGPCGSALLHTTQTAKSTSHLFDGDHLAYLRLLGVGSMRRNHKNFFDGWKLVWEEGQNKEVKDWEDNVSNWEKGRGTSYHTKSWEKYENDVEAMTARWVCSPNSQTALEALMKARKPRKKRVATVAFPAAMSAGDSEEPDEDFELQPLPVRPRRRAAEAAAKKRKPPPPKKREQASEMKVSVDNTNANLWFLRNKKKDAGAGLDSEPHDASVGLQQPSPQEEVEGMVDKVQDPDLPGLPEEAYVATDSDASRMSTYETEKEQHQEQHEVEETQTEMEESTDGQFASV